MSNNLKEKILKLENLLVSKIDQVENLEALEEIRVLSLGKKGEITNHLKNLKDFDEDLRIEIGAILNKIKTNLIKIIDQKKRDLGNKELEKKLINEKLDVTLNVDNNPIGYLHPLSKTIDEISAIFADMGFEIATGPDIETDYYNFSALNIPSDHPARQEHDTFYLKPDEKGKRKVLRTHTSPVQIRTMEKINIEEVDELRVIVPGRTYRSDHDATHSPMFHQCEGLVVGKKIKMSQLKGTLIEFCRIYFNSKNLPVRFRPSYFPFTEPSAEVDIGCKKNNDGSLSIGEGEDWLEILGSGMVHPKVLSGVGIDVTRYQGFAFGMGLERLTMLKYGIPDLRPFYESDLRWLKHYGFLGIEETSLHAGINGVYS